MRGFIDRILEATIAVLLIITVVVVGQSLRQGDREPSLGEGSGQHSRLDPIPAEAGVFKGLRQVTRFIDQETVVTRTLETYYARRAYPGAPPAIPHPIDQDMRGAFQVCSGCHAKGGFVPEFGAYAPVTPHPEYANCRQCHVPASDVPLLVESGWQAAPRPALGRAALPGGPPPIPHGLQLRENCAACHTGPAAPVEIRTGHPERINCRQCHVPAVGDGLFSR